ncbi:sugar ABC transporter substrate-binding protein [Bacillus sp. 03113]|uniref:sugar ABC transporter substrate-binding protein n=1 Tax=Bacillus sp. 03113 TaxID=2578211 RepID=UPI0011412AEE|nr:sugar ABC transporter substrate-binding protein [Bacillus sp. 03113]
MRNKKLGIMATIMLSCSLVLGACSSKSSSTAESKESKEPLQVWVMGAEGQRFKEFLKGYEKEHGTEVDVLAIPWGDAHDKLLTAVASGKGPDVLQIGNTWVPELAEAGTFLDLTDKIKDYPNLKQDNFFESSTSTTKYKDKILAIPYIIDTRVLFYRTDLLASVGFPKGPETWDDTVNAASKLAKSGQGFYGIDIDQKSSHIPMMFAWEQGWNYDIKKGADNFKDPKFKKAIELYNRFFKEGMAQLEAGKETVQAFNDGTKPMFISGPYMVKTIQEQAPDIKGKWDVKVMPKGETSNSIAGGSHLAVFNNTDQVKESLEFINYMADPKTQVEWYKASFTLPPVKSAWDDPVLAEDPILKTFGKQIEMTKAFPMIPEYENMSKELLKTLEQINRGGEDIDKALTNYQTEVKDILSK